MFNPLRGCNHIPFTIPRFRKLHQRLFRFNQFMVLRINNKLVFTLPFSNDNG